MNNKVKKNIGKKTAVLLASAMLSCGGMTEIGCALGDGMCSLTVSAAENETPTNSFEYKENYNGTVTITKFIGSETMVFVPEKINGKTVWEIGRGAFMDCVTLKSIIIPECVNSIGENAFRGCTGLTDVNLPKGIQSIDPGTFQGCSSLKSIIIPDSVAWLWDAFSGCDQLESITIPGKVKYLYDDPFRGCNGLINIYVDEQNEDFASVDGVLFNKDKTELIQFPSGRSGDYVIPDTVSSIDMRAFQDCKKVTGVYIPSSVTDVGWPKFNGGMVFNGCSSLLSINVDPENSAYMSIDGVLFYKDKSLIVCCPGGKSGKYTIPDGVTEIGWYVFAVCDKLTEISIPGSVKYIGCSAFEDCTNLTSAVLTYGINDIGVKAFYGCPNLKSITVPSSVTYIKEKALGYCDDETGSEVKVEDFTIYGVTGSVAEEYANENGFAFVPIINIVKGDTNGDGTADIADALMISRYDAGLITMDSTQISVSDVNGDDSADIADALMIARYDAGLIDKL